MKEKLKSLALALMLVILALVVSAPNALQEGLLPLPIDLSAGYAPKAENFSENGENYSDESIEVKSFWGRDFDTDYLVLQVKVKDPSQIRTAPANGTSFVQKAEVVGATIANRVNAVLAINGDYFTFTPYGYVVRQGKVLRRRPNGEDVLVIDNKGNFHTVINAKKPEDMQPLLDELEKQQLEIQNSFSFGPSLIVDNNIVIPDDKNYQYMNTASQKKTQRISLSQVGELEYLIISTCGPENKNSKGLKMFEMAELTHRIANELYPESGAKISYNLDGGSSNTVVMQGRKINSPNSKIRPLSDIIYFATLVP